jgi:hypothetical protein
MLVTESEDGSFKQEACAGVAQASSCPVPLPTAGDEGCDFDGEG